MAKRMTIKRCTELCMKIHKCNNKLSEFEIIIHRQDKTLHPDCPLDDEPEVKNPKLKWNKLDRAFLYKDKETTVALFYAVDFAAEELGYSASLNAEADLGIEGYVCIWRAYHPSKIKAKKVCEEHFNKLIKSCLK